MGAETSTAVNHVVIAAHPMIHPGVHPNVKASVVPLASNLKPREFPQLDDPEQIFRQETDPPQHVSTY
jgi:hypothetical protein